MRPFGQTEHKDTCYNSHPQYLRNMYKESNMHILRMARIAHYKVFHKHLCIYTQRNFHPVKINSISPSFTYCFSEGQVPPPCGLVRDCSSKSDGSYVEYSQNCTSYYTCSHHVYFGHNFCTPGKYNKSAIAPVFMTGMNNKRVFAL